MPLNPDFSDEQLWDPTSDDLLRTHGGRENPAAVPLIHLNGTGHPRLSDLHTYTGTPEPGAISLPSTILLVNQDAANPLERSCVYGVDLALQSAQRSTHLMVLGLTGSGKNQRVLDPLRASAIADPTQTVISFSLKPGDSAMTHELCRRSRGRRPVTLNLCDPWRSICWNPLATDDADIARDLIRRFSDAARNPMSSDSEFWAQWVRSGLLGCWEHGLRSFPEILRFFSQPYKTVTSQLQQHGNPNSTRLADFLQGGSHNAETVMASILGALQSLLSVSSLQVLSADELNPARLFRRPVVLQVEISEPQLETHRPLVQMLARSLIDSLISTAEALGSRRVPATLFFDDMPSLGHLLSVERLLTLRSRGIGVVAGVQSISALELAYGPASRSLLEAFAHKVVLPGCAQPDADYFAHASGETFVALPCYEGQQPVFASRPLLSPAEIRHPSCQHTLLGPPATLLFGSQTFQAYLHPVFELPTWRDVLRAAAKVTGRERLRRKLPAAAGVSGVAAEAGGAEPAAGGGQLTNTAGWSKDRLQKHLAMVRDQIGWQDTTGSARKWWDAFENENASRLPLVIRLAEELRQRKATISDFFLAYVYSNTDNIQANLHYLDFTRAKKQEASRKKNKGAGDDKPN